MINKAHHLCCQAYALFLCTYIPKTPLLGSKMTLGMISTSRLLRRGAPPDRNDAFSDNSWTSRYTFDLAIHKIVSMQYIS